MPCNSQNATHHDGNGDTPAIERQFWTSADDIRANSRLRSSEYSTPMRGLIFPQFAEQLFPAIQRKSQACDVLLPNLIAGDVGISDTSIESEDGDT